MSLLSSAAQAFYIFASCCNPAGSLSPQDMQSQPTTTTATGSSQAKA